MAEFSGKVAGEKIKSTEWNAQLDHAFEKAFTLLVRYNTVTVKYEVVHGSTGKIAYSHAAKATAQQWAVDTVEALGGGVLNLKDMELDASVTSDETVWINEDYQGERGSPYAFPYSCLVQRPDPDVAYYEAYKNIGRKYTILKRYDDAATVIQAVINALSSGGQVFVKTPLTISSRVYINYPGIEFVGENRTTSIIDIGVNYGITFKYGASFRHLGFTAADYYIDWFFQYNNTTVIENIVFEDCYFTGKAGNDVFNLNWNTDAAYGLNWTFTNNIFKDLIIKNPTIAIGTDQFTNVFAIVASNVTVSNNVFDNVQARVCIRPSYNSKNVIIHNNKFRNFAPISEDSQPIAVMNGNCNNIQITGNTLLWDANPTYIVDAAILLYTLYNVPSNANIIGNQVFSDPTFSNVEKGVYLHGKVGGGIVPRKIIVEANNIYGVSSNGISTGYGIADSSISRNIIENVGDCGVFVDDDVACVRNIIANNIIRNANRNNTAFGAYLGVGLYVKGDDIDITGNMVTDTTPYQRYAIYNTGLNNRIMLNTVSGAVTATIGNTDAGTKIFLNKGYVTENHGNSTGTGGEQTIAHGLVGIPNKVTITPTMTGTTVSNIWADATNIYPTVTLNKTYNWSAEV